MASLTANQRSFIEMMRLSDEHAIRGFELLLRRAEFLVYFDPLVEAGLFAADRNPSPVRSEEGGYRVSYWKALDYLIACAKSAGERSDSELAAKILAIVRNVNAAREPASERANFITFAKFAELIGWLPTSSVTAQDLQLVEGWLSSKFDNHMVAHAIAERAIPHFLDSTLQDDWNKALQLFKYCTAIRWQPDRLDSESEEPITIVDAHWLQDVTKYAGALGRKVGQAASELMVQRVGEVFGKGARADWTHVFRPAVGKDGQNHRARGAENIVVDALRDVLLGWTDVDPGAAKPLVGTLLASDNEMLRRVGIYVLTERWEALEDLCLPVIRPGFFSTGHLHELYGLLRRRFELFDAPTKEATIRALRAIPVPDSDPDAQARVEHLQFRYLNAIASTSYGPAARWFVDLTSKYGPLPKHPNYLSFMEFRVGPGPSQYKAEELVALAGDRTLPQKLAAFKPSDSWEGPSAVALTDQLERAVQLDPSAFIRLLPDLLTVSISYQHAVIAGLLKLWREPNSERPFQAWGDSWPRIFDFFEALLASEGFWSAKEGARGVQEVTPMWIASSIADLLEAGTRDDARAYPAALLPRGWSLLGTLLLHGQAVGEPSADPMMQAINSTRGRALEAVFSHALRACRLADKSIGDHNAVWLSVRAVFDKELAACANGNFEFSTLAAAYSGNLEYMSMEWLEASIKQLFPVDRPPNLVCAVGGLAYAATSRKVYRLLRDNGVVDAALRLDLKGRHGREKLLEKLAVGYLWGEDTLDSDRFRFIFDSKGEDLTRINFFLWTIRGEALHKDQVQRIVAYWRRCLEWAATQWTPPPKVVSSLSGLVSFLPTASGANYELLLETAPYVDEFHGAYDFLKDLTRLVEASPKEVCAVLAKFLETHLPSYDYEDRMRHLVARLAELGHRAEAIAFCDRLRALPGLYDLFLELTAKPQA